MDGLLEFMKNRNINDADGIVQRMRDDKIDCSVMIMMTDGQLAEYIPFYGDRIAVSVYLKRNETLPEKQTLIDKIRGKIGRRGRRGQVTEHLNRSVSQIGNSNAAKTERRVELGWLMKDQSGLLKQVKMPKGGGTRHLTIAGTEKAITLLQKGEELFFPNGLNHKSGERLQDHHTELFDSNHAMISGDITIKELYNTLKVKILRVYLVTHPKSEKSPNFTPSTTMNHNHGTSGGMDKGMNGTGTDSNDKIGVGMDPHVHMNHNDTGLPMQNMSSSEVNMDVDCDFLPAGTPTISFRRRRNLSSLETNSTEDKQEEKAINKDTRKLCEKCFKTYDSESCIICEQNKEFEETVAVDLTKDTDSLNNFLPDIEESLPRMNTEELRRRRVEHFQEVMSDPNGQTSWTSNKETEDRATTTSCNEEKSTGEQEMLTSILKRLSTQKDNSARKNIVNVDRADVLDGGIRAFQRTKFNEWAGLSVKFAGEDGIDNGGLTREFLQLAVQGVKHLPIFTGGENSRSFTLDYKALEKGLYKVAGKIMAYSVVHGGPLPCFFSQVSYTAIAYGLDAAEPGPDDIPETDLCCVVKQIGDSTDQEAFAYAVEALQDTIYLCGCMNLATKFSDKDMLIKKLCHFLVVGRPSIAISNFMTGLEACGLLAEIQQNPSVFQQAFLYEEGSLDALSVETFLAVPSEAWSEVGSNKYQQEKRTMTHWRDFLQDLEDLGKLDLLLQFALGLKSIPPLGVNPVPKTFFKHKTESSVTAAFPSANTCSNILRIPVLESYEVFKQNMLSVIETVLIFTDE